MSNPSWAFEPDEPASTLLKDFRSLTGVEDFDLAVILGSGWHEAVNCGEILGTVDYSDYPCFPADLVSGHSGQLIAARISSWNVLFFSGRFHCYQGLSAFEAALPVRLASAFGCPRVLLTCATGAINLGYRPGDFMLVEDHMNFLGDNPLRGLGKSAFVDLSSVYAHEVYNQINMDKKNPLPLHRGVIAAMPGPCYETPAEIRFLATAGADVVSMSTVHEAIMARYLEMSVAAVAFISNPAAGIALGKLSHDDVLACSHEHTSHFPHLVASVIHAWQTLQNKRSAQ